MDGVDPYKPFLRHTTVALSVVTALSLIVAGWAFWSTLSQVHARRQQTSAALRTVLCFFDSLTPPKDQARADRIYRRALELIDAPPCEPRRHK